MTDDVGPDGALKHPLISDRRSHGRVVVDGGGAENRG
jgi:hypothetical protein